MFADPQSVTINAIAKSLPRVSTGDYTGVFKMDTGEVTMSVKHTNGARRTRRSIRLDHQKTAVDPLVPAQNVPYSMSMIITVDVPNVGYTVTEAKQVWDGFLANLAATSGLNTTKLLGGES